MSLCQSTRGDTVQDKTLSFRPYDSVDDVLSLVILAVISNLGGGGGGGGDSGGDVALKIARPILVSAAVVAVGFVTVRATPRLLEMLLRRAPAETRPDAVVCCMLALTLGLTVAAGAAGSTFLLGAFAGGLSFARAEGAAEVWGRHEELSSWLTSVFFLSVGLQIPLGALFSPIGFALGLGYTVPAVVGKLVTGGFTGSWGKATVVGWAMVGRGELGFVMAQVGLALFTTLLLCVKTPLCSILTCQGLCLRIASADCSFPLLQPVWSV
jgi:Kef-type K+ transport system membrane component KefB